MQDLIPRLVIQPLSQKPVMTPFSNDTSFFLSTKFQINLSYVCNTNMYVRQINEQLIGNYKYNRILYGLSFHS